MISLVELQGGPQTTKIVSLVIASFRKPLLSQPWSDFRRGISLTVLPLIYADVLLALALSEVIFKGVFNILKDLKDREGTLIKLLLA